MNRLIQFSIPVQGLRNGSHQFDFQIDDAFFAHFEDAPIKQGQIELELLFDKRPDMQVLLFDFKGTVQTNCDRCLAGIQLPISGKEQLIIKSKEEAQDLDDPDVVFVDAEDQKLDISPYAYEFICLALPMIKVYDCEDDEPRPCNDEMLAYLENEGEEDGKQQPNPLWDDLRKQFGESEEK